MSDGSFIAVISLTSGLMILSKVSHNKGDDHFTLDFPLEMNLNYDVTGAAKLYVNRYMPYANDDSVLLNALAVESVAICSEQYQVFYKNKVNQFKKVVLDELKSKEEPRGEVQQVKKKDTYH